MKSEAFIVLQHALFRSMADHIDEDEAITDAEIDSADESADETEQGDSSSSTSSPPLYSLPPVRMTCPCYEDEGRDFFSRARGQRDGKLAFLDALHCGSQPLWSA